GQKRVPVRLMRFEIKGFRSCRRTVLFPESHLTALVGVNGSGKSNLLQAVLLLTELSRGRGFRPRLPRGFTERRFTERGLRSEIEADFAINGKLVLYRATVSLLAESTSAEEIRASAESWNFKHLTG